MRQLPYDDLSVFLSSGHYQLVQKVARHVMVKGEYPLAQCGSSHTKRKCGCTYCKQGTWQQEQTNTGEGENEKCNHDCSCYPEHDPPPIFSRAAMRA